MNTLTINKKSKIFSETGSALDATEINKIKVTFRLTFLDHFYYAYRLHCIQFLRHVPEATITSLGEKLTLLRSLIAKHTQDLILPASLNRGREMEERWLV